MLKPIAVVGPFETVAAPGMNGCFYPKAAIAMNYRHDFTLGYLDMCALLNLSTAPPAGDILY